MKSSFTQPEIHLEEVPKGARHHRSLSTITAAGPAGTHHGNRLRSTETALLLSVEPGVSIQRSTTDRQKRARTYRRTAVEDETMEELPATPKLGGTLCKQLEKAPRCTASTRERAVFSQELRVEERHRPGVPRQNLPVDSPVCLPRGQSLDLS